MRWRPGPPAIQGFALRFVATVMLVNLAVDLLSARIDPRLQVVSRGLS